MKKFLCMLLAVGAAMAADLQNGPEQQFNSLAVQWKHKVPAKTDEQIWAACSAGLLVLSGATLSKNLFSISGLGIGAVGVWVGSKYFDLKHKREQKEELYVEEAQRLLEKYPQIDETKLTSKAKILLALAREIE